MPDQILQTLFLYQKFQKYLLKSSKYSFPESSLEQFLSKRNSKSRAFIAFNFHISSKWLEKE
jgi:hypothetical protein